MTIVDLMAFLGDPVLKVLLATLLMGNQIRIIPDLQLLPLLPSLGKCAPCGKHKSAFLLQRADG